MTADGILLPNDFRNNPGRTIPGRPRGSDELEVAGALPLGDHVGREEALPLPAAGFRVVGHDGRAERLGRPPAAREGAGPPRRDAPAGPAPRVPSRRRRAARRGRCPRRCRRAPRRAGPRSRGRGSRRRPARATRGGSMRAIPRARGTTPCGCRSPSSARCPRTPRRRCADTSSPLGRTTASGPAPSRARPRPRRAGVRPGSRRSIHRRTRSCRRRRGATDADDTTSRSCRGTAWP